MIFLNKSIKESAHTHTHESKFLDSDHPGMTGVFKLRFVIYHIYIYIERERERERGRERIHICWLVGSFVFYGISTFVGYLSPNPFHTNNQFYFKQFSLAWVHSLIVKNNSISSYAV